VNSGYKYLTLRLLGSQTIYYVPMNSPVPLRAIDAPADENFRAPPQNLEAEQALLGALLSNNEAADRVSNFLHL
jgi:DnaB-like helicase N terminal domain